MLVAHDTWDVFDLFDPPLPLRDAEIIAVARIDAFVWNAWEQIATKAWLSFEELGRGLVYARADGGQNVIAYITAADTRRVFPLVPAEMEVLADALQTYDPAVSVIVLARLPKPEGFHYVFRRVKHHPAPPVAARAQRN